MDKQIYGQGHGRLVPDDLIAEKVSHAIYERAIENEITPNIALANADFEGDLLCGNKVKWIRRDTINEGLFQEIAGNEEPETDTVELCSDEAEICGSRQIKIKVSNDQLRRLHCEGLDTIYLDTIEATVENSLTKMWDESHLAHAVMMACSDNTGNNAMGLNNLGSPDNPIVIPKGKTQAADALENVYYGLYEVLSLNNAMTTSGDTALILPTPASVRSMPIFQELNVCCGNDNVRIKGQLPSTILGFDAFQTNRQVLTTMHNGKRIYYLIAMDKHATGFVSEMYNFKWWEGMHDWFLVGTEVHGSYVVQPEQVAVACISFA